MIIGNVDMTHLKNPAFFDSSIHQFFSPDIANLPCKKNTRTPTHFEPLTGIGIAGTEGIVAPALETWINCLRVKTWGVRPPCGETAGVTLVASVVVGLNIFKYLHSQLPS